jgi:flap endonuclease-1
MFTFEIVNMGNAALRELSVIDELTSEDIANTTVVVDAHNWLYKYMLPVVQYTDTRAYTTENGVELPVLIGATQGMKKFFEHNLTPLFVFDGGYHTEKQSEVDDRKTKKKTAKSKADEARKQGDNIRAAQLDAQSKRLTDAMVDATKQLLEHFDVNYTTAPTAGESQAAYIARQEEGVHYVISDDYDSLLFKAPCTVRNFTSSDRSLEGLDFQETLMNLELTHNQLVDCAILCGTDYNEGVYGYGPKTSVKAIKEYGDIQTMIEENEIDDIQNLNTIRNIFLQPQTNSEYSVPKTVPDPDIDSIKQFLKDEQIDFSEVETTINSIEELISQPSLEDWGI